MVLRRPVELAAVTGQVDVCQTNMFPLPEFSSVYETRRSIIENPPASSSAQASPNKTPLTTSLG
jgi:hypothetical protein